MYHWRRYKNELASGLNSLKGIDVVASACGHLVDYQSAVGDVDDVDCPACLAIDLLIRSPSKLLEDARGLVYSWRHGGGGDNLNERSDRFITDSRTFLDLGTG